MRILLAIFVIQFAATSSFAQSGSRWRQLEIEYDCTVYIAALAASEPKQPESSGASTENDGDGKLSINTSLTNESEASQSCPRRTRRLPPQYPNDRRLFMAAPHACVFLRFDVNELGRTENISVLKRLPEGHGRHLQKLNAAATGAVENWCYEPKIEDGAPVRRDNVTTRISFSLENKPEPWETPDTEKEYAKRAERYEILSKRACDQFLEVSDEIMPLQRIPDAKSDDSVVNAAPLERNVPQWPASVSSNLVRHACTIVRFDVNENGETENIEMVFGAPTDARVHPFFDETLAAVKDWKYTPATKDGAPIRQSGLTSKLNFVANE